MCQNMDVLHDMVNDVATTANANKMEVSDMNQYNRRLNAMVGGIPKTENENVEDKVVELFNAMEGVSIEKSDISIAHRMPESSPTNPPDIIVRFMTRKKQKLVYENRKNVSNIPRSRLSYPANPKRVFISENLSKMNNEIFYNARQLKKQGIIKYAWTKHGKVHIRQYADSEAIKINTMKELDIFR